MRGDGAHVWDESGRRYLDATAGLWFANVGFGPQATSPTPPPPRWPRSPRTPRSATSRTARRRSWPNGCRPLAPVTDSRVFLTSGGSDSIDTATKMARRFWQLVGQPERTILIRRERAYHGMHTAGTSLAGIPANAAGHGELIEDVVQVRWDDADDLRSMIEQVGADKVAAFFCEPVIGAGGVYPAPDGYLSAARAVCRETGVLFVADEVITGFGRCGAWFASGRLGARTRHHHVREGHHQRLPADGRRRSPRRGSPSRSGRRAPASGGTATPTRATRRRPPPRSPTWTSWSARACASERSGARDGARRRAGAAGRAPAGQRGPHGGRPGRGAARARRGRGRPIAPRPGPSPHAASPACSRARWPRGRCRSHRRW